MSFQPIPSLEQVDGCAVYVYLRWRCIGLWLGSSYRGDGGFGYKALSCEGDLVNHTYLGSIGPILYKLVVDFGVGSTYLID